MVRLNRFAAAAVLAGSAFAAPMTEQLEKRTSINLVVLQFALTLEHLENVFYEQAIKKFSVQDFIAAGYSEDYYNDIMYIGHDENVHVQTLTAAIKSLGAKPVAACTYNFPYNSVDSFIFLSQQLENIGVSAYSGAAQLITSDYYLTVAASILAVEALHTSLQRTALGEVPMANPFETPLDGNSVFTLASQLIVKCPASNYKLPFKAFPYLTYDGKSCTGEEPQEGNPADYVKRWSPPSGGDEPTYSSCSPPKAGDTVTFTATGPIKAGSYVTFNNGLNVASSPGKISGKTISATIPSVIAGGQTYAFITSKNLEGTFADFSDAAVEYGPAAFEVYPGPPTINYNIQ